MVSDVMLCDLPFPVSSTHLCCAHTLCLTVFGNKQYIHTYKANGKSAFDQPGNVQHVCQYAP